MAKTSLGEYSIKVTGDATQFERELAGVVTVTKQTTLAVQQVTTETTRMAGAAKTSSFAIQQLAFGLQDAVSVMGTAGLAGAVRAASNNVIQFASILSPVGGTIAAVATTAIGLMADQFARVSKETVTATKAIADYTGWAKDAAKAVENVRNVRNINNEDSLDGAKDRAKQAAAQIEDNQLLIKESDDRIRMLRRRAADVQARAFMRDGGFGNGQGTPKEEAEIAGYIEQIQVLQDQMTKARLEIPQLEKEQAASVAKARELEVKKGFDLDIKMFEEAKQKQVQLDAKAEEAKRKKAIDAERDQRKFAAGVDFEDLYGVKASGKRPDPLANNSAAEFRSREAIEALARSRVTTDDTNSIDRETQRILQDSLAELRGIREAVKDDAPVVEEF